LQKALLQPSHDPLIEYHLEPRLLYLDAMYQAQTKCFWQERDAYLSEFQKGIANTGFINNIEFAFHLLSLPLDAQSRLSLTRNASAFIQDLTWLKGLPPFQHAARNRDKIRIGYFSSDFRAHPTGLLSRQLFELHDRDQFEIFIYSTFNAPEKEHVRLTVENNCDVFRDVSRLNDAAVAQQIYRDEIDILIDFNGYTAKSRSCVLAMRPAPVQVLYLAYLQSMGAEFIDYTILDNTVCPSELEKDWQESIARLPHSLYLYDTETPNVPSNKSRCDYGLPIDAFVFCCLNIPYKIEPQIFDVWMDILHAVPHSVLWLLGNDALTVHHLTSEAAKRNISVDRLIFAEPLPHAEHLHRYQYADLFIDTFWCGAHTTALDALWQGLPVLCCTEDVSTARVGASLLHVLEMPELVTDNFEQYREKAVYYASHPDAHLALKNKLTEKKLTTPLFNSPLTVKHIEKAYQIMWQRYLQGLAPATFDVPEEMDF
jgi:protein O-GlcNAc transferase